MSIDSAAGMMRSIGSEWNACEGNRADSLLLAQAADKLGGKLLVAGRFSEARPYFQSSLILRKRLFRDSAHRDILRMYHNIGMTFKNQGDYHPALTYFDSSDVWTSEGMPVPYINNKLRKGQVYLELDELNNALYNFQIGYDSMQANPTWGLNSRLELISSFAACLRQLRAYDQGIEKVKKETDEPYPDTYRLQLADLNLELGNLWQDSMLSAANPNEARQQAIFYTRQALHLYQDVQPEQTRLKRTTLAAANLGELYRRAGQFAEAERVLTQAIASLPNPDSNHILFAQLYINRGETYYDQQRLDGALSDYNSALHYLAPAYQPGRNVPLPALNSPILDRNYLILLLGDIGQAYLARAEAQQGETASLEKAAVVFDTLFQFINRVRGDFISDEAKLTLAARSQVMLRKAFQSCVTLYDRTGKTFYRDQAFRISEQSKAFVLLEAARLKNLSNRLPPDVRQEEQDLLLKRTEIDRRLFEDRNDPRATAAAQQDLLDNMEGVRMFQQKLKKDYPNYYTIKYQGTDLSIEDIQQKILAHNQALVEYFFQDSSLYIFCITPQSFDMKRVAVVESTLNGLISQFRAFLEKETGSGEERRFLQLAHALYGYLLAPVESNLPERLFLIPTGALNNLPFEALYTSARDSSIERQANPKDFVLFQHAVSYCFSANLLREMQAAKSQRRKKRGPAIFASGFNPALCQSAGQEALPAGLRKAVSFLTPLGVNQETEVNRIADNISSAKVFPAEEATKNNFLDACRQFAMVHIPTHGILNEEDPGFSFISFTQSGKNLDLSQLLFVKDLYAQHWDLDLAFFSACQTASGHYLAGEGNISMARGLAYAGVRSFITTQWNIPTATKSKIAPLFYEEFLNKDNPKDVALATAKRAVAGQYPPREWAGLILIGATD